VADRAALNATKLEVLVRGRWGEGERQSHPFPGGAALTDEREGSRTGWFLLDERPAAGLGPALVLADRFGARDVHVLADDATGLLARRARSFARPPQVWRVDGRELVPASPDPVAPPEAAGPAPHLAELLVDHDLEVVVEGGAVRGELLGLEVARIAVGATSGGVPIDEPLLEVGVGQADRELTAMVHGSLDPVDRLARVVEIVRATRRAGAPPHPLNRLVPERWLRAVIVAEPGRIGLDRLRPAVPAVARPGLRERAVAMAVGERAGERVVVACSVGVDLDLVPAAADARLALAPGATLLLVVPERDAVPATHALARRLASPAEVVAIDDGWRAWGSP
jgi:hypothetical protein